MNTCPNSDASYTNDEPRVIPFPEAKPAVSESPARAQRRLDVLVLRRRGMLPMAIADTLGCPDFTVRRILRDWIEAGELDELPGWYTKGSRGWGSARAICPTCGRAG
jgi:hypothetical protein